MKNIKFSGNSFILICLLIFLSIPLIQNQLPLKKYIKPLKGSYASASDTLISADAWFSGRYQSIKDKFLAQNYGFRNYYVMLDNQINYKLFNQTSISNVIIGKGDFLYETEYINAYYGNDFIGVTELSERYKKIKALQDYLSSIGIDLEIVFTPSKASFYPEFIPNNWVSKKKVTNYDCALALCKKLNINHVDLNTWFRNIKNITPYDLYPKTGIHWSNYGALIAADSLKKHIEANTRLNLRDIVIRNITFSDSLIHPDNDMGEVMNLLYPIKTFPMPYASYYWKDDEPTTVKPKALFIADSYFWQIYSQGLANNLFSEAKFWYYNQSIYPETEAIREVSKVNLLEEIKKQQVIVIMATEINVHDIGWGFIEHATEVLQIKKSNPFRQKIYVNTIKENIKNTPEWMADIKKKAEEKKISIDEMVTLDAIYVYETDYCKPEVVTLIEETKERIKNTKEWIEQIRVKAKEKGITEAEMLELDAKYLYDTELKKK